LASVELTLQIAKAEKAVAGKVPVKRNRFIKLVGGTKSINRPVAAKARAPTGLGATSPTSTTRRRRS
jgi:hypothetical protein